MRPSGALCEGSCIASIRPWAGPRLAIAIVAFASICPLVVGGVLATSGNGFALSERDRIVGGAQGSEISAAYEQDERVRAALLDFGVRAEIGWGGRIRTFDLLIQSQAPYRLATPQRGARETRSPILAERSGPGQWAGRRSAVASSPPDEPHDSDRDDGRRKTQEQRYGDRLGPEPCGGSRCDERDEANPEQLAR
jgi:hypothetical protein